MKRVESFALSTLLFTAAAAFAQDQSKSFFTLRTVDVSAGYTAIRANAPPPGTCGCLWMNGGNIEAAAGDTQGLAMLFNFGITAATNLDANSGHDLTLTTYLGGPRYSFKEYRRITPYAQGLLGAAHASTNNALDDGTTSFAFAAGAGVDVRLSHRFSWRVAQAEFLLTHVPNGANNSQNQLRLISGIVFHLKK